MRVKIGDVIEMETKIGLAYAQCTNEEDDYGFLIHVFEELHSKRPKNFAQIVQGPVRFYKFFPIAAALRQKVIKKVATEAVAPQNREFPWFRYGTPNHRIPGTFRDWRLWRGGDKYIPINILTDEHRKLPMVGVVNLTWIVEQIEEGWRPEHVL